MLWLQEDKRSQTICSPFRSGVLWMARDLTVQSQVFRSCLPDAVKPTLRLLEEHLDCSCRPGQDSKTNAKRRELGFKSD